MRNIPIKSKIARQLDLEEFFDADGSLHVSETRQLYAIQEKLKKHQETSEISAGNLRGLQLLIRIYRFIIAEYIKNYTPSAWNELAEQILQNSEHLELHNYVTYLVDEYQINGTDFVPESIVLWLCNKNKALRNFKIFFDDSDLKNPHIYDRLIKLSEDYFAAKPRIIKKYNLLEFLQLTMQQDTIQQQLEFILNNFGSLLGELSRQLLEALDILQEETAFRGGGPGPAQVYDFADSEYERFSEDREWMSKLVLLAKSTYVWLAQLSKKYNREITRLDQIPPEELEEIAARGFSGIWLIGIWERSAASQKIKQLKGDYEAIASAYSIKNYRIAAALGGDAAMHELQKKAWHFGIRIGCDMVPNHTGLDSDWIVQHPDWFLQEEKPPFPAYRFFGQNLSERSEIEIYLEDHYYDHTDAAVVFKLYDRREGKARYIYHGNDGTSIPWNDTAQLNYLLPQVREAVIKEILSISRQFPIIRFDAAMTLAKKHIQRLWFPERGSGGAIPGRSRFALSRQEFDHMIPNEFWREVVDRVAKEAPDTLLLAEAFWMMEGYFVRTLGMHRVYNSAFMNMLKAEENYKYRESINNVLAFNPQILKRFVNFMSNPDEETAFAQFGTDDKYFGVCVLMSTMPGLPMFAHGQIEGFTERYGMEYAKPKLWERPNKYLVERHKKEIFPLLKRRELFSDVENFVLYDFITHDHLLNENVFAFSNEFNGQCSLVVFHNVFQETFGSIHRARKSVPGENGFQWQEVTLAESWNLHRGKNWYTIFTDAINGLTYVRKSEELCQYGLNMKLSAYEYHVYWNVTEVYDSDGIYQKLQENLRYQGTTNLNRALKRVEFAGFLDALSKLLSPELLKQLVLKWKTEPGNIDSNFCKELSYRINKISSELLKYLETKQDENISESIAHNLIGLMKFIPEKFPEHELYLLLITGILVPFSAILHTKFGKNWYHESLIDAEIEEICSRLSLPDKEIDFAFQTGVLVACLEAWQNIPNHPDWLAEILSQPFVIKFLGINEFDNIIWFNREPFTKLIEWIEVFIPAYWQKRELKLKWTNFLALIRKNLSGASFQLNKLLEKVREEWQSEETKPREL